MGNKCNVVSVLLEEYVMDINRRKEVIISDTKSAVKVTLWGERPQRIKVEVGEVITVKEASIKVFCDNIELSGGFI